MFNCLSFTNKLFNAKLLTELSHQSLFRQLWPNDSLLLKRMILQVLELISNPVVEETLFSLRIILSPIKLPFSFALCICETWLLIIVSTPIEKQRELLDSVLVGFNVFDQLVGQFNLPLQL